MAASPTSRWKILKPAPTPRRIRALILGRLAIHKIHHQLGIGTALVGNAVRRAIQTAEIAGVTALLVHAISEQARRFYRSRGFVESPSRPTTLCLMLATADRVLSEM